ncbi:hypothetical protein C5167_046513 [Papaver somniferum]|uniref:Uncharacterized protein n=1 Tax=Papaver somniferum TaxID=3469 RepID=A0A4Y7LHP6_PAPSO|nr:hypothetical protein C5167_046513 [Papaver somniferum]
MASERIAPGILTDIEKKSPANSLEDASNYDSDSSINSPTYSVSEDSEASFSSTEDNVVPEGSFSSVERPSGLDMLRMTYTDSESDSENGSYPDHEGAANGLETLQMNYGGPWTDTDLHDVLYLEFLDILDTG